MSLEDCDIPSLRYFDLKFICRNNFNIVQNQTGKMSVSLANRTCETAGCNSSANLQCPTCIKLGIPGSYFCSQVSINALMRNIMYFPNIRFDDEMNLYSFCCVSHQVNVNPINRTAV